DLVLRHVLGDMRQQDRVEASRTVVLRRPAEFTGCERGQSARFGAEHAVFVDVDADALPRKMQKVAADPATNVECEHWIQASQVPAEDGLNIDPLFPPGRLQFDEPLRVIFAVSRDTCRIHVYQRAPGPGRLA